MLIIFDSREVFFGVELGMEFLTTLATDDDGICFIL